MGDKSHSGRKLGFASRADSCVSNERPDVIPDPMHGPSMAVKGALRVKDMLGLRTLGGARGADEGISTQDLVRELDSVMDGMRVKH
jgi:hypothetical protein